MTDAKTKAIGELSDLYFPKTVEPTKASAEEFGMDVWDAALKGAEKVVIKHGDCLLEECRFTLSGHVHCKFVIEDDIKRLRGVKE